MDRLTFIQFLLLFLALPTQYFISQYWTNDTTQRSEALNTLLATLKNFKHDYLRVESWKDWYLKLVIDRPARAQRKKPSNEDNRNFDDDEESVAIEVMAWRKKSLYYAESSQTRMNHFEEVKFQVGQVVKHKTLNIHGVIIGWDLKAEAPQSWLEYNYDKDEREALVNQPHYLILIDSKYENKGSGKYYIAQEHAELMENTLVDNKIIKNYFKSYENHKYVPKKYLKIVYPYD